MTYPVDRPELRVSLKGKILPAFYPLWNAAMDPKYLRIVAEGGRNSSKSTTIACIMIHNRMTTLSHGLVIRRVDKTLRKSCRSQLIWAIKHLEVAQYWHWSDSPSGEMTLTYIPTGTKIFFEGANNPDNLKSWKTEDYPTIDVWFEEAADFKIEDGISTIEQSILRAKLPDLTMHYKFFYSYNPPKRKQSWINKKYKTALLPASTYVHHSNYLDNPFCSQFFIDEAEHIRATNPRRYDWQYLGEPIGAGIVPFDNLVFRTITQDEIDSFDNIRQGNDWGYAVDPNAFVRWHYDKTRRKIYALDEIYAVKLSNTALSDRIHQKDYHRTLTSADSAEPKSIDEMRGLGCRFKKAKKGAGSVEYGEKWLDELEEIVIDPRLTPHTAKEFEEIDYQTDRDGNSISRLEDNGNHAIDATRYAFERDMGTKSMKVGTN